MKFTLNITVDSENVRIKDECMEAVAKLLQTKRIYFHVGYNPNEISPKGYC
jgi:hypothetical protein